MFYMTPDQNLLLTANRLFNYGYWTQKRMENSLEQFLDVNNVKPVVIGEDLDLLIQEAVKSILISDVPDDAHELVVILFCKGIYVENAGSIKIGSGRELPLRIDPANLNHIVGSVVVGYGQGVFE